VKVKVHFIGRDFCHFNFIPFGVWCAKNDFTGWECAITVMSVQLILRQRG